MFSACNSLIDKLKNNYIGKREQTVTSAKTMISIEQNNQQNILYYNSIPFSALLATLKELQTPQEVQYQVSQTKLQNYSINIKINTKMGFDW